MKQIENLLKIFARNNNEGIDELTYRLCNDRDFCALAEINYSQVDYSSVLLEVIKYRLNL